MIQLIARGWLYSTNFELQKNILDQKILSKEISFRYEDSESYSSVLAQNTGNIDSKIITTGSTIYLPVSVEGALFGLGDVHSAMGDGEISGTGVEVASDVKVTLSVLKGKTIPRPMVETEDSWYTIASHEDTQAAIKLASEDMHDLLVEKSDLSPTDAYLLMSVSGDAEISQSCKLSDLDVVMRFKMPKLENLPDLLE